MKALIGGIIATVVVVVPPVLLGVLL